MESSGAKAKRCETIDAPTRRTAHVTRDSKLRAAVVMPWGATLQPPRRFEVWSRIDHVGLKGISFLRVAKLCAMQKTPKGLFHAGFHG
jgi:hypothetical protein